MGILDKIKRGAPKLPPRIVLIGKDGVGKTTAGLAMPNPLFVVGDDFSGVPGMPEDLPIYKPTSWDEMQADLHELRRNKNGFDSIVFDNIEHIVELITSHVLKVNGITAIGDLGHGKGYVQQEQHFLDFLQILTLMNESGWGVMVSGHSQIVTYDNPVGENYNRYGSQFREKLFAALRSWAFVVLFAEFAVEVDEKKGKVILEERARRIVRTTETTAHNAKNRHGLPTTMAFNMPLILRMINVGVPGSADHIREEIGKMLTKLPKAKQSKIKAEVESAKNIKMLAHYLVQVREEVYS
jgi:hypothetical protein